MQASNLRINLICAAEAIVATGAAGAISEYLLKHSFEIYNNYAPEAWKISSLRLERITNIASRTLALLAGFFTFGHQHIMKKYGHSDEMPIEMIKEMRDEEFINTFKRLFPDLIYKR